MALRVLVASLILAFCATSAAAFQFDVTVELENQPTLVFHLGPYFTYPYNIALVLVLLLFIFVVYRTLIEPLLGSHRKYRPSPISFDDIAVGGDEHKQKAAAKRRLSEKESKQVLREMQVLEKKLRGRKSYADEETASWDEVEKNLED